MRYALTELAATNFNFATVYYKVVHLSLLVEWYSFSGQVKEFHSKLIQEKYGIPLLLFSPIKIFYRSQPQNL